MEDATEIRGDEFLGGIWWPPSTRGKVRGASAEECATEIRRLRADLAAAKARIAELQTSVVAFCAPWAAEYAAQRGLPPGHLHAVHYDILKDAGACVTEFVRVEVEGEAP